MYIRDITGSIVTHLRSTHKITMLVGARQTGKTTLMKYCSDILQQEGRTVVFFTMEQLSLKAKIDENPEYILTLLPQTDQRILLCIDEIQYLSNPTNFLKYMVDIYSKKVQLFVTGSSSFYIDHRFIDSLAGRQKIFTLYPLSFREFLTFKKKEHLIGYLRLPIADHVSSDIRILRQEYLVFGGYPELVLLDTVAQKKDYLNTLLATYMYKDIYEAGIRMPYKYMDIMKVLAAQTGKMVNMSEIASLLGMSVNAVQSYIYTMQVSCHIGLIRPFAKNIRKEITKMPKVYFFDPGIRNMLLNDFRPLDERGDIGEMLENMYFQIFARTYRVDQIQFWRTKTDQEVDFVIDSQHAYEIKTSKDRFKPSQYKGFVEEYSQIPLVCYDRNDAIVI